MHLLALPGTMMKDANRSRMIEVPDEADLRSPLLGDLSSGEATNMIKKLIQATTSNLLHLY
jgi:hypothetical protein